MDEKELFGFSWSGLFLVTAVSSILFSFVLKLLDGSHSPLLIKIGVVSAILGLINILLKQLSKPVSGQKKKLVP
ncbi:MAG: hypothetical protein JNM19_05555 [Chitinophagaceae bacterium]|nr:hypothetical protein [Chitinophagaceae bacterium]